MTHSHPNPEACRLDLARLQCVRVRVGGKLEAACPACREMGRDGNGDHLAVFPSGAFACARHPGDKAHLRRVLELVGRDFDRTGGQRGRKPSALRWTPQARPSFRLRSSAPAAPEDMADALRRDVVKGPRPGTDEEMRALARLRSVNVDAVGLAQGRGLILFGSCMGWPSWFLRDERGDFLQARRLDGGVWMGGRGRKDHKAHTIGTLRPVGVTLAAPFPRAVIVEGGPDVLAACYFLWAEDAEEGTAVICMPGTSASFSTDDLVIMKGKPVRIFPHHDEHGAGRDAAVSWGRALQSVGCAVDLVRVEQFPCYAGRLIRAKDLNELTGHGGTGGIHPDTWESQNLARNLMTF